MTAEGRTVWPAALLFDLDGTLIDSVADIAAAVNELLALSALGPLTVPQVRSIIGRGVETLVERAFFLAGAPLQPNGLKQEFARMQDIYPRHLTGLTTLMPAAAETLAVLSQDGIALGLATNKPQRFIEIILDYYGLAHMFGSAIGGDAGVDKKPAPDMLIAAMDELGVGPRDTVMVGDSSSDVAAARAAGVQVVIVRGGYTTTPPDRLGADLVIASLGDLPVALPDLRPPS